MSHPVAKSCEGQKCGFKLTGTVRSCGQPASHKVGEEIQDESLDLEKLMRSGGQQTNKRHNLTVYICCQHFAQIFGPIASQLCKHPC